MRMVSWIIVEILKTVKTLNTVFRSQEKESLEQKIVLEKIFVRNWAKKVRLDFGRAAAAGFDCRPPFYLKEPPSCHQWPEFFNPLHSWRMRFSMNI